MKKLLIAFAILLTTAFSAHAGDGGAGRPAIVNDSIQTTEVLKSTYTCQPISISTMGANVGVTDVIVSTNVGYNFAEVQNLQASDGIWCGEAVNVSTSTTQGIKGAGVRGTKVPAGSVNGNPRRFQIPPASHFYCVCDAASGTCDADVCKGR